MNYLPRFIPVLLLKNQSLVKSVRFKNYTYIGDPLNAVRNFNELLADELVFLDINATIEKRTISKAFIERVGEEAEMPFAVGGGINSLKHIEESIAAGAEKVVLGTAAVCNPDFVKNAAYRFGSSTISVCIDVGKNVWGKEVIKSHCGSKTIATSLMNLVEKLTENGAGELIIQSISHDGLMKGYNLSLIEKVARATSIPVVALGGAGSAKDFALAYHEGFASALAAGSYYIYQGVRKGVLINYPSQKEKGALVNYD